MKMFARVFTTTFLVWVTLLVCHVNCEDENKLCKDFDEYHWVAELDGTFQETVVPVQDMNDKCSKTRCATKCCKPSEVFYESNDELGDCFPLSKVRNKIKNKVDNEEKFDYSKLFIYEMNDTMDIIRSEYTINDVSVRFNRKFYQNTAQCTLALPGLDAGRSERYFMLMDKTTGDIKLTTENQNRWKNPSSWNKDDFCFEYVVTDFEEVSVNIDFWAYNAGQSPSLTVDEYYERVKFAKFIISTYINSSIFLLLVVFVYASLPQLRQLPGKVQMAYCATYAVALILNAAKLITQLQLAEYGSSCNIGLMYLTIVIYYLLLSSFFWMNIMSFDIWWTFRGMHKQRQIHRKGEAAKFRWYALYAMGTPLLITVAAVIIDRSDLRKYKIIKLHFEDCLADSMEIKLYLHIPIGVLLFFNVVFFGLTTYSYWRIKKELTKFKDSDTNNGKFRFIMYFKLAVVMGVGWIFNFIEPLPKWLEIIVAVYNGYIGITIFIVFVVKRNIIVKFIQRYGLQHRFKVVATLEKKWSSTKTQRGDSKRSMTSTDSGVEVQMHPLPSEATATSAV